MPPTNILSNNLVFHVIVEREVVDTPFGQITFNFEVTGGKVRTDTLNIVKNVRIRYKGIDREE
jgi:hypothetical protein